MGILFVLVAYAIVLTIAAAVGAAVLGAATFFVIPRAGLRRKIAMGIAMVFPFGCVAYAGAWFVGYALINVGIFHHDPGLGDSWYTPLPNGYRLLMIDVTGQGIVYNPKTQPPGASVGSTPDDEFGVRKLQVAGNLIFGARDSNYFQQLGEGSTAVDRWFELNTKTGSRVEYPSLDALRASAAAQGVRLHLRDFYSVYSQYRFTWFDDLAAAVLVVVPLVGFGLLVWWIWWIRREELAVRGEGSEFA
jgi:hypothetical protein